MVAQSVAGVPVELAPALGGFVGVDERGEADGGDGGGDGEGRGGRGRRGGEAGGVARLERLEQVGNDGAEGGEGCGEEEGGGEAVLEAEVGCGGI